MNKVNKIANIIVNVISILVSICVVTALLVYIFLSVGKNVVFAVAVISSIFIILFSLIRTIEVIVNKIS